LSTPNSALCHRDK